MKQKTKDNLARIGIILSIVGTAIFIYLTISLLTQPNQEYIKCGFNSYNIDDVGKKFKCPKNCGDEVCSLSETAESCPIDCGTPNVPEVNTTLFLEDERARANRF